LRLSGSAQGVQYAADQLGGETAESCWDELKEQALDFFDEAQPLTRISLPPASSDQLGDIPQLIEWGGAQRWVCGEVDISALRSMAEGIGGNVCAFRRHATDVAVFHPLPPAMLKLQRSIKSSFDPARIFNPGRIYPGL